MDTGDTGDGDEDEIPSGPSVRGLHSDQDIRDFIRAGDHEGALMLLMKRHGQAIFRFCREQLRDAALAEDVHQQVFIQAYRDLGRYEGRSSLKTWLFAIAHHRILDAVKARSRHDGPLDRAERPDIPDHRPGADERIDDAALKAALWLCLEGLDPRIRAAVLLRFQQGLTFEEMAEISGEKPGTLEARVRRALPNLRECIETRTGGTV